MRQGTLTLSTEQERSEANDHAGHSGQPNTQGEDIESRIRTVLFDDSPTGFLALLVQKIGDRFEHMQHEQSALLDKKIDDRINQWFQRRQHEQSASHHSARDELRIPTETKLDADSTDRRVHDEVHIPTDTKLDADSTDRRGRDEVHIPVETRLDADSTDQRGRDIPIETKLEVESTDRRGALASSGCDVVDISSDESEFDVNSTDDESEASFFVKKSAAVHFASDENRCAACSSMKVEPVVFFQMKKMKKKNEKEKKIKVEAHS
ncbi:uncharacterized protein LOC125202297 [Salvia hispanica]|uniref:uncharacterized protein LOC125202297 n=1 Tax=Salvia hispanica TaxID=49212 RepID=UPI00200901E2|nr:uncharacterized protein LOC125202297 [Salvia hispanica]